MFYAQNMIPILLLFDQYALLILRVCVGAVFLAHGIPKIKDLGATAKGFESMGFRPGRFWGTCIALLEVVGGALLIAGLLVQPLGFLFALEMLVAILMVKRKAGFVGGWELELILIAASVALFIFGGGRISVEGFFMF